MKLYRLTAYVLLEQDNGFYIITGPNWDELINQDGLYQFLNKIIDDGATTVPRPEAEHLIKTKLLSPVGRQEVWASGVTYFKSMEARMEESKDAGGGDFYDRVYSAARPELFFKATAERTVGSGKPVRIRRDSTWNVPEPELTLFINSQGRIQGYSIGNDMSSRSIEGENPLYLPQAKTYDGSAAIGPCLYISESPLLPETLIEMEICRERSRIFYESIAISRMKRGYEELAGYLYMECSFPWGCFLMTGTGIVPPNSFTLLSGDEVRITIEPIGTLINVVS